MEKAYIIQKLDTLSECAPIREELSNRANTICHPITLQSEMVSLIENKEIDQLLLIANGNVLAHVDIIKHPRAVHNDMFYPFFTDEYFNIYDLPLEEYSNITVVGTLNNKDVKRHRIDNKKEHNNLKQYFLCKNWDGKMTMLIVIDGCICRFSEYGWI